MTFKIYSFLIEEKKILKGENILKFATLQSRKNSRENGKVLILYVLQIMRGGVEKGKGDITSRGLYSQR